MRLTTRAVWGGFVVGVAFLCADAFAVSGIAVAAKGGGGLVQGSIERADIENNKVTNIQTIYSAADGLASIPCISQNGRRVCFFRDGDKLVNGQTVKGTTDYVSVMDIDGKNLENLVEITGTGATNRYDYTQGGPDRFIDWPEGDWIYYQKPATIEIWRVNHVTKVNELVITFLAQYDLPYIGRFNLSSGGNTCTYGNKTMSFPDTSTRKRPGAPQGCNHTVSASGRFVNGWRVSRTRHQWWNTTDSDPEKHPEQMIQRSMATMAINGRIYNYSGHAYIEIIDWDWATNAVRMGLTWNDCYMYSHWSYMMGTQWLMGEIGTSSIGQWSEMPRWAANSDKWLLHSPERGQVLWNWADRQLILGSRSKKGEGPKPEAGDFWVKPPHDTLIGTHYEDISGNWVRNGQKSTAPLPEYIRCPGLTNAFECGLKYGSIVIMPQSVYDKIVMRNTIYNSSDTAYGAAPLIPDLHSIVVQGNGSIALTVTNEKYDGVDPAFGRPPTSITWKVVGEGAAISPATGDKATLTTTSSFSACSIEVTITTGSVTKTVRKLASTQAVAVGRRSAALQPHDLRISSLANGAVNVSFPWTGARSVEVYRADGARVYSADPGTGSSVTIPSRVLAKGMYVLSVTHGKRPAARAWWTVK